MKSSFLLSVLFLFSISAFAQSKSDFKAGAEFQIRWELDARDFTEKTPARNYASIRSRADLQKSLGDIVTGFVQFQDSRTFGQVGATMKSIDNIDLHQGYVLFPELFKLPVDLQIGRFEMSYGNERIFARNHWNNIGRAFEGLRVMLDPGIKLDLFALSITDSSAYINQRSAAPYPIPDDIARSMYGFWSEYAPLDGHRAELFGYYDYDRRTFLNDDPAIRLFTFGTNYYYDSEKLSGRVELAYQTGDTYGIDVAAYLAAVQAMFKLDPFKIGAGADIYSGDRSGGNDRYTAFHLLYGARHKFFGNMDYFPARTYSYGIHDYRIMIKASPFMPELGIDLTGHYFRADEPSTGGEDVFGTEIDLTLSYKYADNVVFYAGTGIFLAGGLMKEIYNVAPVIREDASFWGFLMTRVEL